MWWFEGKPRWRWRPCSGGVACLSLCLSMCPTDSSPDDCQSAKVWEDLLQVWTINCYIYTMLVIYRVVCVYNLLIQTDICRATTRTCNLYICPPVNMMDWTTCILRVINSEVWMSVHSGNWKKENRLRRAVGLRSIHRRIYTLHPGF